VRSLCQSGAGDDELEVGAGGEREKGREWHSGGKINLVGYGWGEV